MNQNPGANPNIFVLSGIPQGQVIMTQSPATNNPLFQRYQRILRSLGIAEVILGSIAVILGLVIAVFYFPLTFLEGMWCGMWLITSGCLGISVSKPNPSTSLIKLRLAFAIVGVIFAFVGLGMSIFWALFSFFILQLVLNAVTCLAFLISFCIMIVSSVYSSQMNGGCCNTEPLQVGSSEYAGQVVYYN